MNGVHRLSFTNSIDFMFTAIEFPSIIIIYLKKIFLIENDPNS